jgi:TPR repeat protein
LRSFTFPQGVKQNLVAAAEWYRRAAEQGLPDAPLNLAIACALGRGVPQDLIKAYLAVSFATVEQRDHARRILPEQIAWAHHLARERTAQQGHGRGVADFAERSGPAQRPQDGSGLVR